MHRLRPEFLRVKRSMPLPQVGLSLNVCSWHFSQPCHTLWGVLSFRVSEIYLESALQPALWGRHTATIQKKGSLNYIFTIYSLTLASHPGNSVSGLLLLALESAQVNRCEQCAGLGVTLWPSDRRVSSTHPCQAPQRH